MLEEFYSKEDLEFEMWKYKMLYPTEQKAIKRELKLKSLAIRIKNLSAKTGLSIEEIIELIK